MLQVLMLIACGLYLLFAMTSCQELNSPEAQQIEGEIIKEGLKEGEGLLKLEVNKEIHKETHRKRK
jgi:hypothetical protein